MRLPQSCGLNQQATILSAPASQIFVCTATPDIAVIHPFIPGCEKSSLCCLLPTAGKAINNTPTLLGRGSTSKTPAFNSCGFLPGRDIGLPFDGFVYCFPSVANYVGGDIVSGLLASEMYKKNELALFMDIGTNGEMLLPIFQKMVGQRSCPLVPAGDWQKQDLTY